MAKKIIAALTDTTLFLQEWLANPQRTGSVAPSSPKLAAAMSHWLPSDPESFVLELGPGTGAVTEMLLKRGLREDRLVAIEHNPKMARMLREKFPRAHIITGDAWQLDDLLRGLREPVLSVGAVISSLPLLNFSPEQAESLAQKIRTVLRAAGQLGSIQLSSRQKKGARLVELPAARLENRLAEFPARARERFSKVNGRVAVSANQIYAGALARRPCSNLELF